MRLSGWEAVDAIRSTLVKLAKLHERGALTDAKFEHQKWPAPRARVDR
jgi:hypothetical protein